MRDTSLWETFARNIGAVRGRGRFLLFLRPDDIVPSDIIPWLLEHTGGGGGVGGGGGGAVSKQRGINFSRPTTPTLHV